MMRLEDENMRWLARQTIDRCAAALTKNGFSVHTFETVETAREYIFSLADSVKTIGFGGSMTLAQLNLTDTLRNRGKELLIHGRPELTTDEKMSIMRRQLTCDLFLSSSNAVTIDGKIMNIDWNGNRNAALTFGPHQVVVVVGINKIVDCVKAGMKRIKMVAAPPNARRLGLNTPCAHTGFCADCDSVERICRISTIIDRKPRSSNFTVLIVNEELGY